MTDKYITEDEIDSWTDDSSPLVPPLGVHFGTRESIRNLKASGFDEGKGSGLHTYGPGLYMYDAAYEDFVQDTSKPHLYIAIRMINPYFTTPEANAVGRGHDTIWAKRKGYDGLVSITPGNPASCVIVAFLPETVRIVK